MKFRGRALQKMRQPDELDRPVALVDPREWIALFVVISIVLGAAIWAFTGSLPFTSRAQGVLTSAKGNRAITSSVAGTVVEASVTPGQQVRAGSRLLAVEGPKTTKIITAPVDGVVLSVAGSVGQGVSIGDTVATIQVDGQDSPLVAQVFVPTSQATSLRPGVSALLAVEGFPQARFGLLKGTISSVARFPVDPSLVVGMVGSSYIADALTKREPTVPVTVALTTDRTASGLAWTTVNGPPGRVNAQHRVDVTFSLGDRTPFDAVLGTD